MTEYRQTDRHADADGGQYRGDAVGTGDGYQIFFCVILYSGYGAILIILLHYRQQH